jgi:hypothetical protein
MPWFGVARVVATGELSQDIVDRLRDDVRMILRREMPALEDILEVGVKVLRKAKPVAYG